ncbi:methyltransferase domain-containing protein [Streptomyces sp. NPDC004288]|uniref:methyltransferase domain-containing protein n=1 Tax=Streptomyces sp. SP18ES09 TaxID=3002532 RepID=UPI002E7708C7|nr:methyltransferase domain-containing protein [Streptomyces sp. SP18ES09]MEE1819734.1 class I SAM-dependent methyltransferase [Streptomyces sp. SP18ES09]
MEPLRDADLASAFDHASRTYDVMTSASPGYGAHLRRSARRLGLPDGGAGLSLLDLGCGTGTSTAALLATAPLATVTGVDASAGMLARARRKSWPDRVRFVQAPVEHLGTIEADGPYDAVFAAYLLRNVADPDAVLRTVHRLLRPGGRVSIHEYTLSGRPENRLLWAAVMNGLVRPWARLNRDAALYRHLYRSVLDFDTADVFAARLRRAGFTRVRCLPQPGWQTGITHTFVAARP